MPPETFRKLGHQGVTRRGVLRSIGAGGVGMAAGVGGSHATPGQSSEQLDPPTIRGSVRQVHVIRAEPDATVRLIAKGGEEVATATADQLGSVLFEEIDPGRGYQVTQTVGGTESDRSRAVRVLPVDYTPPDGFYQRQKLDSGYNYIEVRDGVELACQVKLPDADEWGEPPYPAVIDYSAYEPSVQFYDSLDDRFLARGYAVVGVNMRGSGCSDGAFDYFEHLQALDGYDMVEAIGAQKWANGVGLVGKSYPGISQLFVAATRPPSLKAIVPGHVVGEFYRDVAYPGGMFNATFAGSFATERDATTAPGGEYAGVEQRIDNGDDVCDANQLLRLQNPGLFDQLASNRFDTQYFQNRAPWTFVDQIDVPTLLVESWQDEQVGSRATRLLERFDTPQPVRFIGSNGDHGEYYGETILEDIYRFLAYYLKEEVPEGESGSYEEALAAYESEDPVEIYWELDHDRNPRFSTSYGTWPPAQTETWRLYFQPDGSLASSEPDDTEASTSYEYDPILNPLGQLVPRNDDDQLQWGQQPDGTYVAFVSDQLDSEHVLLGSASVELWLQSDADDTDIEVTLSEVRPDGTEMYVQNGWLRASHRAEDASLSKPRRPWHTHQASDQVPLPDGFSKLRVELFPFGHVFRAGSRVKVAIETPGGNRPLWGFQLIPEEAINTVAHSSVRPSSVALPLLPTETTETDRPDCGAVSNQPCRPVGNTDE
ncbi:CocE/NonD family hydrolase [Salinirubellus salinus]|uniref:CocE/NonD family hydrolase n=1 Tax=Salinirubellus salinus TaxID=1364945 RepID=A0A9E7U7B5_9EURY|nr:CocE/NonD family hydrolase [Salinirubellus salinus]UWM53416.1 CocE/NonD family hydrolase [Salinirubellus salinus]